VRGALSVKVCQLWKLGGVAARLRARRADAHLLGPPSSRLVWGGAVKSRGKGCRPHPLPTTNNTPRFRSLPVPLSSSYNRTLVLGLLWLILILKCASVCRECVYFVCVLVLVPRPP
jgi:hypothetical protein